MCESCWYAPSPLPPPRPVDPGVSGGSAYREYDRRKERAERRSATETVAIPTRTTVEPARAGTTWAQRSVDAWAKGGDGERALGDRLDRAAGAHSIVLHDRRVPGTKRNIDHLVISPAGVWVIDAKNYSGLVECRKVGPLGARETRLYVKSRNQTELADNMGWQVDAVLGVLRTFGFQGTPVYPVICFTNSEWKRSRPIQIGSVSVTWPEYLVEQIRSPGPLDEAAVRLLGHELGTRLPAAVAA